MHAPERVDSTYKKIRDLAVKRRNPVLPALSRDVPGRMRRSFLWVNPGPDRRDQEDLTAQIALFLLHAKLLHQSGRDQIEGWLLWYLATRFKLEDVEASQTLRELRRYVRPPSATSWTAYVRLCIPWIPARRAARREHPHENGSPSGTVAGNGSAGEAGADLITAKWKLALARDTKLDRDVALKVLPQAFTSLRLAAGARRPHARSKVMKAHGQNALKRSPLRRGSMTPSYAFLP